REEGGRGGGGRFDAEAGGGVVERQVGVRSPARVERHATLPEEQRVEQLARRLPAAAAATRDRLQPVVPLADALQRGGRGAHAVPAAAPPPRPHPPPPVPCQPDAAPRPPRDPRPAAR